MSYPHWYFLWYFLMWCWYTADTTAIDYSIIILTICQHVRTTYCSHVLFMFYSLNNVRVHAMRYQACLYVNCGLWYMTDCLIWLCVSIIYDVYIYTSKYELYDLSYVVLSSTLCRFSPCDMISMWYQIHDLWHDMRWMRVCKFDGAKKKRKPLSKSLL